MKLDFDLPFAFRGRPKGCRDIRDIFITKTVSRDVPEVSHQETEITFSVADRRQATNEPNRGEGRMSARLAAAHAERKDRFELRVFRGDLYRKIANSVSDSKKLGLFGTPFEQYNSGRRNKEGYAIPAWQSEFGAGISPVRSLTDNAPLARPLMDEMTWIMDRDRPHCDGARSAWPPAPAERNRDYNAPYHIHRNTRRFEDEINQITEIDWASMALADHMIEAQAGRLLLIAGEVWIKSRPPAIAVDHASKWRDHNQVHLRLVTAPEGYVSKLSCTHFSLADIEVAREYAKSQSHGERILFDYIVPFECHDSMLLDYDWRTEAINRFSYTAAVECRNYMIRNPEKADKITDDERSVVAVAFDATMEVNHLLGIHRDMSEFAIDLKSAWRKFSYRQCLEVASTAAGTHVEPAADNIEQYLDEAPISIPVSQRQDMYP
jgi:hypothetical protein